MAQDRSHFGSRPWLERAPVLRAPESGGGGPRGHEVGAGGLPLAMAVRGSPAGARAEDPGLRSIASSPECRGARAAPLKGPEAPAPARARRGARGHWQLAVRGCISAMQATLSLFLVIWQADPAHSGFLMACQLLAAATFFRQWRTASPWMFVARSVPSFARCGLSVHLAICGRRWFWDTCDAVGWRDERKCFRVLHVLAALWMFLNGLSLVLQFCFPGRGVTARHGHEQLLCRGCVRMLGVPLHASRGVLKVVVLTGTRFERSGLEVTINFVRCVLISASAWSLWRQWRDTGTGLVDGTSFLEAPGEERSPSGNSGQGGLL
uniref:Uncharacterized protein n=1 Tax=Alexandrium monilatum TaxID=311494 RepID=A0A7S4QC29_9DINO